MNIRWSVLVGCVVGAFQAAAVEYEYRPTGMDPFVPAYSTPSKQNQAGTIVSHIPAGRRFVLRGVWKAMDAPWRALVSERISGVDSEDYEPQPLTVKVGDSLAAGVQVVSIEDQSISVVESVKLEDGRIFQKKSRIGFDEEK